MLSPVLLDELRAHWRRLRKNRYQDPSTWLYCSPVLGHHDRSEETAIYLHLSQRHLHATASPLDALVLKGSSPQEE
jgi:hypothetical protein